MYLIKTVWYYYKFYQRLSNIT